MATDYPAFCHSYPVSVMSPWQTLLELVINTNKDVPLLHLVGCLTSLLIYWLTGSFSGLLMGLIHVRFWPLSSNMFCKKWVSKNKKILWLPSCLRCVIPAGQKFPRWKLLALVQANFSGWLTCQPAPFTHNLACRIPIYLGLMQHSGSLKLKAQWIWLQTAW